MVKSHLVTLGVAALVLLPGCGGGDTSLQTRVTTTAVSRTDTSLAPSPDSSAVMSAVDDLDAVIDEWNSNQIEWIVALQDPDVSYAEFLTVQQDLMQRQMGLVATFDITVRNLPSDLASAFEPLVDHLVGRIPLLQAVFGAAATGTDTELETAMVAYVDYVSVDALDAMEQVFSSNVVDAALRAEGLSGEELVEVFRRMLLPAGS